jgi:cysteine-rich repeat protein
MSWKQILLLLLAALMTIGGCMDVPEPLVCPNGLLCPSDMYCTATGDICVASPCGDGILDALGSEECDDGNLDSGDGCSQECKSEGLCGNSVTDAEACSIPGRLALGIAHTCVLSGDGAIRCWGGGDHGQLGYGNTNDIGDNEIPAWAGTVDVGSTVIQAAAGSYHTCVLLVNGAVRCWGLGIYGQLGYGNTNDIGADEAPVSAGSVDIGGTVIQLAAGLSHTCALLNTGTVHCWGRGDSGRLGYGNTIHVGDNEAPASAGIVDVGGTVTQLAAGSYHTCALMDTGAVRCWGSGQYGQLGYGNTNDIGDNEAPASAGMVDIGVTVTQLAAGANHTCALMDTGAVRCWGSGQYGQLGYGNTNDIGDNGAPASAGMVDVGGTVTQLAAGANHTCALLNTGAVRCWGLGNYGQLGYGDTNNIGDDEVPASVGIVNVGGTVTAVAAGALHTCALMDTGAVRCWGRGTYGQLGYGNTNNIGNDESPSSVGTVSYE